MDWFRLTTFFALLLDFLLSVSMFDENSYVVVFYHTISTEVILESQWAILIGLITLRLAEVLILKGSQRTAVLQQSQNYFTTVIKRPHLLYGLIILVGFGNIFMIISGVSGFGNSSEENLTGVTSLIFTLVHSTSHFVLLVLAYFRFSDHNEKHKILNLFFVFYFLVSVFTGFLSGMKENVITPFILVSIPYFLSGRKLPVVPMIIGMCAMLFLYPFNNNYRDLILNPVTQDLDKPTLLGLAFIKTFSFDNSDDNAPSISDSSEMYGNRFFAFKPLMFGVENEEVWNEYKYMDRYIYIPISWILPRFLIPDKPRSNTGKVLYKQFIRDDDVSITPSTYGWSYMEGGLLPVAISFFLFGAFCSYIQKTINISSVFGITVFAMIVIKMLKVEADIYFRIVGICQLILVNYILVKLLFVQKEIHVKS